MMNIFKFYKEIKSNDVKVIKAFAKLEKIYKDIPNTQGCIENINNCGAWCCFSQSPQLLYIEFLYIWEFIKNKWSNDQICNLIEKSMLNVIKGDTTKECIFFDKKNKRCKTHGVRSYSCRLYGITPKEEFQPRYERIKEKYKDVIGSIIKDQCNLVKTCNGEKITIFHTNKWWKKLIKIEEEIGVKEENINDKEGGSYRMPHDHLLLFTMPENVLSSLAGISLYDNIDDKIITVKNLVNHLRNHFKKNA